ncbi:hypothetical protein ACQEVB_20505 [Pseudonocardia sp. CA-107938]|uniref:hypothetical protein n=1 Tax=Pseudonocardia sp. CA-107938 TaxID=3240021 RepID=UPI003D902847
MTAYEVLAADCHPQPACPKVVRLEDATLVVVGEQTASSNRVRIGWPLFTRAVAQLGAEIPAERSVPYVDVVGTPIDDAAELLRLGAGIGEAAVSLAEADFVRSSTVEEAA